MRPIRAVAVLFLLTVVGCTGQNGGEGMPELAKVTGTVTMDGAPLPNVTVTFTSPDGQSSFGLTDADGKYELTYRNNAKGAQVGENKVTIETPLEAPPGPGYKDPIPEQYNTKSTLTAMVKAGEDNTFDFKLTKKKK